MYHVPASVVRQIGRPRPRKTESVAHKRKWLYSPGREGIFLFFSYCIKVERRSKTRQNKSHAPRQKLSREGILLLTKNGKRFAKCQLVRVDHFVPMSHRFAKCQLVRVDHFVPMSHRFATCQLVPKTNLPLSFYADICTPGSLCRWVEFKKKGAVSIR